MPQALVTTGWLREHLGSPDVRVIDATWFLPNAGRDARADYDAAHIPGAVFFDLDEVCEPKDLHPHMVPSPLRFGQRVRKLGLGDGVRIVVYDDNRFFASARVWWMFRFMGAEDVRVLDGGLAKWRAEGGPVTDEPTRASERDFTVRQNNLIYREMDQVRANLTTRREQLLDAAERYEPERGVGFVNYAHYRIRGAMLDHVRDAVRADPALRARVAAQSAVDTLITTRLPLDAPPPDDPAQCLAELLEGMATAFSLAEVVASTTATTSTNPEEAALDAERQRFVVSAVERMPEREREMLLRVYYEGQSVAEAGRALGLERSWASRLHAHALDRLRHKLAVISDAL